MTRSISPQRALRRFGFKRTVKGGVILGIVIGVMMGAQNATYASLYSTQAERDKFVASLQSAPAINFLSGEPINAGHPESYMIYKSITLVTLATAVWGLLVVTRLLRGYEEDGQAELLQAGAISRGQVSRHLLLGYAGSFLIAMILSFLLIWGLSAGPKVGLPANGALLTTAGIYAPGLLFATLGVLTSQLAASRGRAITYGLVPLIIFYVVRGFANGDPDWNNLKYWTPFGWTDVLNPVLNARPLWLLPSVIIAAVLAVVGLMLAARRDLGSSFIKAAETVKSRFYLLGSPLALAIRQQRWRFLWWTVGTVAFMAFMASIISVASGLVSDSSAADKFYAAIGGSANDLKVVLLGAGLMLESLLLAVMAATGLSAIRGDEAKGYLDNLLVRPVGRRAWLSGRLALIGVTILVVALLSAVATWLVAGAQDVHFGFDLAFQNTVALLAAVWALLAIGVCLYGLWPRVAVIGIYALLVWSFMTDILKAAAPDAAQALEKSSFLHYVPTNLTQSPDWPTVIWLTVVGLALMAIGIVCFSRRDITSE